MEFAILASAEGHTMGIFFDAATILVREEREALLVLAAIDAYLARLGAADRMQALIAGAAAGVVASLGTAWAFAMYNNGARDDLVEAGTMLGSAGQHRSGDRRVDGTAAPTRCGNAERDAQGGVASARNGEERDARPIFAARPLVSARTAAPAPAALAAAPGSSRAKLPRSAGRRRSGRSLRRRASGGPD